MIAPTSWDEDSKFRTNPEVLTKLLRTAVPVLKYLEFSVIETAPGFARSLLPLSAPGSNQHGVHQAAVLAIAADYTGGIALGSIAGGAPVIGVHPQVDDNGMSLWAADLRIEYKKPSSGNVVLSARVPEERHATIKERYFKGRLVLEQVDIDLEVNGEIVSKAEIRYFMRQALALRPQRADDRPNAMFLHMRKSSARLIAGLRALEQLKKSPLFEDKLSGVVAGEQGRLLADRFIAASPQLQEMVANRTKDIDDLITNLPNIQQLVLIGVGLDTRPFRLAHHLCKIRTFEVDLADTLLERQRVFSQFGSISGLIRTQVVCNVEIQDLSIELCNAGFDSALPSLFVIEGVSMYFQETVNRKLLREIAALSQTAGSRVWIDIVHNDIVERRVFQPEVEAFLDGIAGIGEPFIWGTSDNKAFFHELGFAIEREVASDHYRPSHEPVFRFYRFCTLRETREITVGHERTAHGN